MGVDFSHCDARWAYSGFNRFRTRLAAMIGLDYDKMDGCVENGRPWDNIIDPIRPLLLHSDCDGKLSPKECSTIAPRLRELVSQWPDGDYDKIKGLELAKGMEAAAKKKQSLLFQ